MRKTVPRGRPRNPEGPMVDRSISFPPRMLDALAEMVGEDAAGTKVPALVRQAVAAFLDPATQPVLIEEPGGGSVRLKFLTAAPAGPWTEALDHAGEFILSRHVADELSVREGDVVVRALGHSMEGAGIPDRALLVMRPLANNRPPRRGTVALVQIVTGEEYQATIKKWISPTELRDGNDAVFALPAKTREIVAIAEAVGVVALL